MNSATLPAWIESLWPILVVIVILIWHSSSKDSKLEAVVSAVQELTKKVSEGQGKHGDEITKLKAQGVEHQIRIANLEDGQRDFKSVLLEITTWREQVMYKLGKILALVSRAHGVEDEDSTESLS